MGKNKHKGRKPARPPGATKTPTVTHTFQWPHTTPAEVVVTGTFDNWQRSVRLDRTEQGFSKDVALPVTPKILYKFVVDGAWKIDPSALQEDDGHNNTNNVLLRQHIRQLPSATVPSAPDTAARAAVMSGVTPEATTAALAAAVPKESDKAPEAAAISSAAPESTTAALAAAVPLQDKPEETPGTFPETPAKEPEQLSVNPIPASEGIGNPVQTKPGEPVPEPSTITTNTVASTATTDKAGYDKDASAPGFTEEAVTTLPVKNQIVNGAAEPHIQSAAPTSTTAALAAAVPLESAKDVPEPVKDSITAAHKSPEAAGVPEAVKEKKQVEQELLHDIKPAPATSPEPATVPAVVTKSIAEAHKEPEAEAVPEAVEEKKEVEQELLKDVKPSEAAGEPAPTVTAETSPTAPAATPAAAATTAAAVPAPARVQERSISPKSREPLAAAAAPTEEPAVTTTTTGPETATAPAPAQQQQPAAAAAPAAPAAAAAPAETAKPEAEQAKDKARKKKNRASALFSKIKEKFK
ncbi:hypothetical protein FQN52_004455 [Onygenales sp. PD_12]|nr:hypothetical protein FQN52_004455 [Onygenales sp. PD_12]